MSSKIEQIARKINKYYNAGRKISTRVLVELNRAIKATDENPNAGAYVAAAKAKWSSAEFEIDDDAIVSEGIDGGAFVQAWIWVNKGDINGLNL